MLSNAAIFIRTALSLFDWPGKQFNSTCSQSKVLRCLSLDGIDSFRAALAVSFIFLFPGLHIYVLDKYVPVLSFLSLVKGNQVLFLSLQT